jgi:hypothetical protein
LFLGVLASVIPLYHLYLKNEIILAYNDQPSAFIKSVIDILYPRFWTEKYRLDIHFFLAKSEMVMYRFTIITVLSLLFVFLYKFSPTFNTNLHSLTATLTTRKNIHYLKILFYSYFIMLIHELWAGLKELCSAEVFYKPVLILKILHIGFPSPFVISAIS